MANLDLLLYDNTFRQKVASADALIEAAKAHCVALIGDMTTIAEACEDAGNGFATTASALLSCKSLLVFKQATVALIQLSKDPGCHHA